MFTNSAATTGVLLAASGSTWTMVTNRDSKKNVEPVDARAVLDKVAELPLSTWNYKAQDDSIRHMGPMAQDFYAAPHHALCDAHRGRGAGGYIFPSVHVPRPGNP